MEQKIQMLEEVVTNLIRQLGQMQAAQAALGQVIHPIIASQINQK